MLSAQQLKQKISINIALTTLLSLAIFGAFIVGMVLQTPAKFALSFNSYALISITAMIVSLVVLFAVLRHGVQSESRSWFVLYLITSVAGAVWEALSRLTPDYDGSLFWGRLLGTSIALAPAVVYLFALAYTGATAIRRPIIAPILITLSSFVAALYATDLIIDSSHDVYPWGFGSLPGPLYLVVLFWAFLPFILSITLLLRYRNSSQNQLIRKQSMLYAVALAIPLIAGGLTDGLLPAINIQLPTLAIFFNAITGVIIYYGIRRYQLFQVDPSVLAESILGTMREAVVVARRDYQIEYTNEEAAVLFGLDPNPSETPSLNTLFPKESWQQIKDHLEKGTPLPKAVGQLTAYSLTGRTVPVQIVTSKLHERENYSAHVLVLSDVSNLTTSYNELESSTKRISSLLSQSQALQKQLADEKSNIEKIVESRTQQLQAAQERIQSEDKLKQEFIALSSHNLRTPLSILKWSMELLKKPSSDEAREQLLKNMESGINHLDEFIRDISTINDLESGGSMEYKPLDLNNILQPLINQTNVYVQTKNIDFVANTSQQPIMVNANALWLQNCVRNLLDNALKFTEQGSITLNCFTQNLQAVIEIRDTGLGIKEEEIPLLFTKFHRGTTYEQYDYEGKGLALYLTKLVIERHGGTILVDSKNGKGSTFTIRLPLLNTN